MNSIGFVISDKNNERRRALLPEDLLKLKHVNQLYFEKGYGVNLGYSDNEYQKLGANIVDRKDALSMAI